MIKGVVCVCVICLCQLPIDGACMRLRDDAQSQSGKASQDCPQCADDQKNEDGKEDAVTKQGMNTSDTQQKQGEDARKEENN